MTKATWGRKGLLNLIVCSPFSREICAGTQVDRNWSRGHRVMLLNSIHLISCLICFLIAPRTTAQGWHHPIVVSWALPHQSRGKNSFRHAYRPVCLSSVNFFNQGFLLPNELSLKFSFFNTLYLKMFNLNESLAFKFLVI